MNRNFKGGNSRHLARALDQLSDPLVLLDRRGQILFVNAALCSTIATDATRLVGKQCQWELAPDDEIHGVLLNAIAPPAAVRNGQIVLRQLPWLSDKKSPSASRFGSPSRRFDPPSPSVSTDSASSAPQPAEDDRPNASDPVSALGQAQLFVPWLDDDLVVQLTLVLFGSLDRLNRLLPEAVENAPQAPDEWEQSLIQIRNRWSDLEDLLPLVGESPTIRLAMKRAQLAGRQSSNLLISGPPSVGKSQVARGIFRQRLKQSELPPGMGTCHLVDGSILDGASLEGMFDVFLGRLRSGLPVAVQQLVLEKFDSWSGAATQRLLRFMNLHGDKFTVVALSSVPASILAARSSPWSELTAAIADIEISLPALRSRRDDISTLAQQFLASYCRKSDRALLSFSPEAMSVLEAFDWPQNLEQLREAVEFAVEQALLTNVVQVKHLPVELRAFSSQIHAGETSQLEPIHLDEVLEEVERKLITKAIQFSPRNRAQAARLLGISRARLLRRVQHLGLEEKA